MQFRIIQGETTSIVTAVNRRMLANAARGFLHCNQNRRMIMPGSQSTNILRDRIDKPNIKAATTNQRFRVERANLNRDSTITATSRLAIASDMMALA